MHLIRIGLAGLFLGTMVGCVREPMPFPLPVHLSAEDQKHVNADRDNLLLPTNKVDPQTLLDTIVAGHLFENGVDRFHMRSEKYLAHGSVVMEADCDRAAPLTDSFTVTVLDNRGRTIRRERYLRAKVDEASSVLLQWPQIEPTTQPGSTLPAKDLFTGLPMTPETRQLTIERNRRVSAVLAATEPATLGK